MSAAAASAATAAAGTLQVCVTPLSTAQAQPPPALMTALHPEAPCAGEGPRGLWWYEEVDEIGTMWCLV
jgi:hypothetical protein